MDFTGERFIPSEQGQIRLEHYHRYSIILDLIKNKSVLDVACGEGYGSYLMTERALSVVGVDISEEAVLHGASLYQRSNLRFLQGSATNLVFPDQSFDIVVSFETLEHLSEQDEMLAEIKRVLKKDGILIISSPNRPVYSEESGEHNPFHVKELDFQELDSLLKGYFASVNYYGQRILMSSVIQPLDQYPSACTVWSDDGDQIHQSASILENPVYFIALCGSQTAHLPDVGMSALYPASLDLVKHYVGFAKWAKSLEVIVAERDVVITQISRTLADQEHTISILKQDLEKRKTVISSLQELITENKNTIESLSEEVFRRGVWGLELEAELKRERAKVLALHTSRSWRLLRPYREIKALISAPRKRSEIYIKKLFKLSSRIYKLLPFDQQTRDKHREIITKIVPRLFAKTESENNSIFSVANFFPKQEFATSVANLSDLAKSISLPTSLDPLVSVIIPVYGKVEYTLQCLKSIAEHNPSVAFEAIVIDDLSPDDSYSLLSEVKGIRLFENEENQGFVRSCNYGAKKACGKFLYFLNNDTLVTSGWMDELLRTFEEFPGTGLAGSMLLYPDGRLQEAGGIIWQDGSAWNFGRLNNPDLPPYNYAREVDYCSGASILVPKKLFDEMGGFDLDYIPAYCEDADLALKIRAKGLRVIYQPLSKIIHFEGITSGTDLKSGTKSYQVVNTKKLYKRWRIHLAKHQANGVDVDNAKDRRATRRALMLDLTTPTPDQDSGSIDAYNHMLLLREMDFQVTFIPEDNFLYMPKYTEALQRAGVEVLYAPYVTSVQQHLQECGNRYDLVFISRAQTCQRNLHIIKSYCPNAKIIFHTVDLHFLRMTREAELLQCKETKQEAILMKKLELSMFTKADITTVLSDEEFSVLSQLVPTNNLRLLPYARKIHGRKNGFQNRMDIVFVGSYQHPPNCDAVKFFVSDILPFVQQKLPDICFFVVGSNPPDEIKALASKHVVVTGFVEDLSSLLERMRLSVAPLRYGAGIKGKIGSSMASGLPVVATALAAEGMGLTHAENIIMANNPTDFANAIVRIYSDEELWNRISENSLEFSANTWGPEAAWHNLASILADIGMKPKRSNYPLSLYTEPTLVNPISNLLHNFEPAIEH